MTIEAEAVDLSDFDRWQQENILHRNPRAVEVRGTPDQCRQLWWALSRRDDVFVACLARPPKIVTKFGYLVFPTEALGLI